MGSWFVHLQESGSNEWQNNVLLDDFAKDFLLHINSAYSAVDMPTYV